MRLLNNKCALIFPVSVFGFSLIGLTGLLLFIGISGRNDDSGLPEPCSVGEEHAICPANDFRLPAADVPKLEFAALHDGDVEAAIRLSSYYDICLNKPCLGEIWRFRAAQLGDINSTRSLYERELLGDRLQSCFQEAASSSFFAGLLGITQRYIRFHAQERHQNSVSSEDHAGLAIQDMETELATARTGSVNGEYRRGTSTLSWPIEFIAYKARCNREVACSQNETAEIVVFPSFDGMCQKAVDVAEERGLPWIVVAIDFDDRFKCRPKEVCLDECCRCVCKVLELVSAGFSLPRSTIVRFAESVTFAEQMEPRMEGMFTVMQAPSYLMCRR